MGEGGRGNLTGGGVQEGRAGRTLRETVFRDAAPLPPSLTCDSLLMRKMPLPWDFEEGFMIHVELGALRYSWAGSSTGGTV